MLIPPFFISYTPKKQKLLFFGVKIHF